MKEEFELKIIKKATNNITNGILFLLLKIKELQKKIKSSFITRKYLKLGYLMSTGFEINRIRNSYLIKET